jgi:hypothetical protein
MKSAFGTLALKIIRQVGLVFGCEPWNMAQWTDSCKIANVAMKDTDDMCVILLGALQVFGRLAPGC